MDINLYNAVDRYGKQYDHIYDSIIEAIINSIQANATNILLNIHFKEEFDFESKKYIKSIEIKDNGDGFNKENRISFSTFCSDYKKNEGCKGIGRLSYLKYFDTVKIISKQNNELVDFIFSEKFKKEDIQPKEIKETTKETILILENPKKDKIYDSEEFYNKIYNSIYYYIFLKKTNCTVNINNGEKIISKENINDIKQCDFNINKNNCKETFSLYYRFLKDSSKTILDDFICVNNRPYKDENLNEYFELYMEKKENYHITLLLKSNFIDKCSDQYYKPHIIKKKNKNDEPILITRDDIKIELIKKIKELINLEFPDIENDNKKINQEIKEEYPYLLPYYNDNDINNYNLFLNKDKIIKNLEKNFLAEKQEIREKFKKKLENDYDIKNIPSDLLKINRLCTQELAEYIVYRNQILNLLDKFDKNNEKIEAYLHDIFMKQREESNKFNLYDTNLWIIDDKFMSYTSVYSDIEISKIKDELIKENEIEDRPDMTIFYKNNSDNSRDIIVIEFKAIGANRNEKRNSISEIRENIGSLKDMLCREYKYKINSIYGYIITKITDKFENTLLRENFTKQFSNGNKPIYTSYNVYSNSFIYVIDIDSLVKDAKSRNEIFINILKNNESLKNNVNNT